MDFKQEFFMNKEKYMLDLKGIAFHSTKHNIQEYSFKFFKNLFFDPENDVLEYIAHYLSDFVKTYEKDILPGRVKKFTYCYSYTIYQIHNTNVVDVCHHTNVRECHR